jgi:hypothetical protein
VRRTAEYTAEILQEAAKMPKTQRTSFLDEKGYNVDKFIFDDTGGYIDNFAWSETKFLGFKWHIGSPKDYMHCLYVSGTVAQEGYLFSYVGIKRRKWFDVSDLNREK